eukprot:Colp12_sorted_trinity150504_noHs@27016
MAKHNESVPQSILHLRLLILVSFLIKSCVGASNCYIPTAAQTAASDIICSPLTFTQNDVSPADSSMFCSSTCGNNYVLPYLVYNGCTCDSTDITCLTIKTAVLLAINRRPNICYQAGLPALSQPPGSGDPITSTEKSATTSLSISTSTSTQGLTTSTTSTAAPSPPTPSPVRVPCLLPTEDQIRSSQATCSSVAVAGTFVSATNMSKFCSADCGNGYMLAYTVFRACYCSPLDLACAITKDTVLSIIRGRPRTCLKANTTALMQPLLLDEKSDGSTRTPNGHVLYLMTTGAVVIFLSGLV